MTIATVSNRAQWQGNGAATVFSFNFEIGSANEIVLQLTSPSGGISPISSSAYSVSGLGNPAGGTITYPLTGSPLAQGYSLTLTRIVPLQQLVDLVNQSNYFPDAVEGALDYLMMAIQQVSQIASYALQAPQSDLSPAVIMPAAAQRASMVLGFDANGNVTMLPLPASVGAGNLTAELGSNGRPGFKNGADFTAGTTTTLTLSQSYGTVANVFVAFDGTYQERDSYTISGNQIVFGSWTGSTFTPAPIPFGITNVDVVGGTTLSLSIPPAGSIGPTQLAPNCIGAAQLAFAISGTTAQRPAGAPDGWPYLDTSLSTYGMPITKSHLSPTGWVYASGTQA